MKHLRESRRKGVIMDDKLSFNDHVVDIARKSCRTLGFIFCCERYFSSQYSIRLLYPTLVRNRLEYCSTVWNPFYDNAKDQIKRVQKKYSRMFYLKFNITHPRPSDHLNTRICTPLRHDVWRMMKLCCTN